MPADDGVYGALAAQHAELAALIEPLDETGWQRPTRCAGWTVADVVLHLAQTDELALASLEGRFTSELPVLAGGLDGQGTVDDGADAMVARDRGAPSGEILQRWRAGTAALRPALQRSDPHDRVAWVSGQLSTQTLTTTRLAECWIHTGDVAEALGVEQPPTDRLRHIARLAWRTLPYAFGREGRRLTGPVAFALRSPNGEAWDFLPETDPATIIEGTAVDLCDVAARRRDPRETSLRGTGPDVAAVLELVRTYA